jgi:hypothetical protein
MDQSWTCSLSLLLYDIGVNRKEDAKVDYLLNQMLNETFAVVV